MDAILKDVSNLLANVPLTAILFTLVLASCIKYAIDLFRRNPRHVKFAKTLPGPPALPFFGNGYLFNSSDALKILVDYEERYGSFYHLWFGKHSVVGTTDIEFLERVFRSSKLLDKPTLVLDAGVSIWGENSIFNALTHPWKKTRKELQIFFTKNSLSAQLPQINNVVKRYVGKLEENVDGPAFNVGPLMDFLSFDVIIEVLLNASFQFPEEDLMTLSKLFRLGDAIMTEKMFKPWLCNPISDLIFYRKQINDFKKATSGIIRKVLNDQRTLTKSEPEFQLSFMELLKQLSKELDLGEDYIHDEAIVMMAAGNVTTASTASYCLLMLAMFPEIQEKVYGEIIEKLGPEDRSIDINELYSLTYLEQVLKETERRFLLVPLIFRLVKEDIEHGTHQIPAGTTVMIVAQAIHMSSKYYENPKTFDPDHFSAEAVNERPKLTFFPFSSGARNCIGKPLAEATLKLIIINFVRRFKFSTTLNMDELELKYEFTTSVAGGYQVQVQYRNI